MNKTATQSTREVVTIPWADFQAFCQPRPGSLGARWCHSLELATVCSKNACPIWAKYGGGKK